MTRFAQLLLLLTSLAPIGLVYAASSAWIGAMQRALIVVGASFVLVLLCVFLLWQLERLFSPVPKALTEVSARETEPLAFLVAYALPLVASSPRDSNPAGLAAFTVLMGLVMWQGQMFHVNPVMALLGYHFLSAKANDGVRVLIISRAKSVGSAPLHVIRISDFVWFHSTSVPGDNGPVVDASQGSDGSPRRASP